MRSPTNLVVLTITMLALTLVQPIVLPGTGPEFVAPRVETLRDTIEVFGREIDIETVSNLDVISSKATCVVTLTSSKDVSTIHLDMKSVRLFAASRHRDRSSLTFVYMSRAHQDTLFRVHVDTAGIRIQYLPCTIDGSVNDVLDIVADGRETYYVFRVNPGDRSTFIIDTLRTVSMHSDNGNRMAVSSSAPLNETMLYDVPLVYDEQFRRLRMISDTSRFNVVIGAFIWVV